MSRFNEFKENPECIKNYVEKKPYLFMEKCNNCLHNSECSFIYYETCRIDLSKYFSSYEPLTYEKCLKELKQEMNQHCKEEYSKLMGFIKI